MADLDIDRGKIKNIWYGMLYRTTDPKNHSYSRYGGRGIVVCDRWRSFDLFYEDMGDNYLPGLSIDRKDNSKGYYPENCRWATRKEQANNRITSKMFTLEGVTKTLAQWIDQSSIKPSTVRQRLYCYGWTIEKALSKKIGAQIG